MQVLIRQAQKSDISWINQKYREIHFVESDFENDWIIIAELENKPVGLGRLVKIDAQNIELGGIYVFPEHRGLKIAEKIVRYLCENNPFPQTMLWCLPFENLSGFYQKFGFQIYTGVQIPEKIVKKLQWCNSENRYPEKVVLLCKNS